VGGKGGSVQLKVGSNNGAVGGSVILDAGISSSNTGGYIHMISGIGTDKSSGSVSIRASNAGSNGVSGSLVFESGQSLKGCSGAIAFVTGNADSGKGGSISLTVGSATVSSGGSITVEAGAGPNSGGDININGGTFASGSGGHAYLKGGNNNPESALGGNVFMSVGAGSSSIVIRDKSSNNIATFTASQATIETGTATILSNAFTVQSWKMGSSGSTATAILRGIVVIDCSGGNAVSAGSEKDIDISASGVQLQDFVVMNPATHAGVQQSTTGTYIFWSAWARSSDSISLRIANQGSQSYSQSGTWVWFAIRSLS
jgi:hypothetical protein